MKAFTLIELMVVMALLLIMGGMTSVFFSRFLVQSNVSNVSDQVASQLRKAQSYAMSGKQNSNWGVRYGSNQLTLFSSSSSAFDEVIEVPQNIFVTGFSSLTFYRFTGTPSATPTVAITGNGQTVNVSVNSNGTVSR